MDLGNRPMAPVTAQDNSGLPPEQGAPQEDQYYGKMKFHVANDQTEGYADEHQLVNDLRQVGYQPLGVSDDGMTITLQGDQGPHEVKTSDVLEKMGWQIKGYEPLNVDHDHVSPELRYIIESPGLKDDDHAKQAVITSRMQRMGIKDPQIVGSGSDWFVFNPGTSQYIALTNKPGFDLGDLGEVGARAPGFLGSGLGAVMGSAGGLPGTVGGTMAGGFAGNRLADAGAAALEPSYMGAIRDRGIGENLETAGMELGTDALAGLGGFGMGKLGSAGMGVLRNGLASRLMKGAGGAAELGGKAVQGAADFMGKGTPRQFGIAMADPTNVSLFGDLAQLPQQAVRGGARGIGKLGEADFMKSFSPDQAARMRDISAKLLTRRNIETPTLGSHIATFMDRPPPVATSEPGAEEILSNFGDMAGKKIGRMRAAGVAETHPGIMNDAHAQENEVLQRLLKEGTHFDTAAHQAKQVGQKYVSDWSEDLAHDAAPKLGGGFGMLGKGIDNASKIGQMGVNAVGVPYDAAVGAARLGGRAAHYGGRALRSAGEGLAPFETPMEMKAGSEELMNRLRHRQTALQRQGYDRNIMPDTLAQNP